MSNWSVYNANGNYLTEGLQGPEVCDEARQVAQSLANDLGESVWLGPDGSEWDELEEIEPHTFRDLMEADPGQKQPDAVRFEKYTVAGEPVVLVNDGNFSWLIKPEDLEAALDLPADSCASETDWYSYFCSATCHDEPLVAAFEAEHGVRNWP